MKLTMIFDGGARPTNPGNGYGSFQIADEQSVIETVRKEYGSPVTNNQAEWLTLLAGLERVIEKYGTSGFELCVSGDSAIAVYGAAKKWKVRHPGLRPIAERVWALAAQLDSVSFQWHPRSQSVASLGH